MWAGSCCSGFMNEMMCFWCLYTRHISLNTVISSSFQTAAGDRIHSFLIGEQYSIICTYYRYYVYVYVVYMLPVLFFHWKLLKCILDLGCYTEYISLGGDASVSSIKWFYFPWVYMLKLLDHTINIFYKGICKLFFHRVCSDIFVSTLWVPC